MAIRDQSFETGPAGNPVSPADSGGGEQLNNVIVSGDGAVVYATTTPAHGSLVAQVSCGAGSLALVEMATIQGASVAGRVYVRFPAAFPSSATDVLTIRSTSNTLKMQVSSTGRVIVQDASDSPVANWDGALNLDTWYRFEAIASKGTTSNNGRIRAGIWNGDFAGASLQWVDVAADAGLVDMGIVRAGHMTTATSSAFIVDDFAAADQDGLIGPWTPGPTPAPLADLHRVAGQWVEREPFARQSGVWV